MRYLRNAAIGSVLALAGAAHAAIVVDDFNDPSGGVTYTLNSPPNVGSGSVAVSTTGSMLGGQRDTSYTVTYTAATTASLEFNTATSPSRLTQSAGDFATPDLFLNYDANGAGLHANLTSASMTLKDFHTDLAQTINVWLTTSTGNSFSASVPVSAGFSGDLTVNSFSTVGSPDIHNINGIKIEFDGGTQGVDYSVHSITVVPEPGAYGALAALGLLGTVVWRRARAQG